MKVAILGSNGFVGKSLCKLLDNKFQIIPVNRQTLDLTNYLQVDNWLKTVQPDVVVNCASQGGKQALSKKEINYNEFQNNLAIFLNFYNSNHTKKFINIGSGAEFDLSNNIDNYDESKILDAIPIDSYSYSKNVIARMILDKPNFYTIRLFGCFGNLEDDFRLLKKVSQVPKLDLVDRYFDYISVSDLAIILENYIVHEKLPKDINCVYKNKLKLSYVVNLFKQYHRLNTIIEIIETSKKNYTGSSTKLDNLGIFLEGLESGIAQY